MIPIIYRTHKEDARGNVLTTPFPYRVPFGGRNFLIPRGFESDGASVPRIFWRIVFPNTDSHAVTAGICHDFIYRTQPKDWTRQEADTLFLALLIEFGVTPTSAMLAYRGVRIGGWLPWQSNAALLLALDGGGDK